MMRRQQLRCGVPGCRHSTNTYDERVSFFGVPKEPHRAKLWFEAIGRPPKSRLVVCELHFTKNFISVNDTRKQLVLTAVPTLNLEPPPAPAPAAPRPPAAPRRPAASPSPEAHPARAQLARQATPSPDPGSPLKQEPSDDDEPDIDIFVKEETTVSQKRPHEAADVSSLLDCPIKRERSDEDADAASSVTPERLAELNTLVALGNAHLEPDLAKYIEAQVQMQKASLSRGKKYDENLSLFALKLYHAFPQTYKLMQKSLNLPTMGQIRRLFRPLRWEADEQWARLLRARFLSATPEQRECVVMVARTPLWPALAYAAAADRLEGLHELGGVRGPQTARAAVLLAARGIHARWCQPLACGLLGADTPAAEPREWIKSTILKLFDVGLNVRALITDFDESFVPTGPVVTVERPYFTVDNKQVYCFYDCTQLMKSFHDYFMEYNINFGGLMATWEDVEEMHEYNSSRAYPLPTGLAAAHVKPPAARRAGRLPLAPTRARARLAVQALALPVAAALAAAVDLRVLTDKAHGTVQVVSTVANFYDTMHNKALSFGTKTLNRDKADAGTNDIKFLSEMIARLEKMSLVDKAIGHLARDPGVLAALRVSLHAVKALYERTRRAGGSALPMRAFNNDPLHGFLDRVHARHHASTTSSHLLAAFKRSFVFNIMKSFRTSPEDGHLEEFLSAASRVRSVPRAAPAARLPRSLMPVDESTALLQLARGRRSAPLLARHLLERCLQRHGGCEPARVYCSGQQLPAGLLRYMELMSWEFTSYFREGGAWGARPPGLLAALLHSMADKPFESPCACFPTDDLKIMFFRFKIHALIEFNNDRIRRNPQVDFLVNMKFVDLGTIPIDV